MSVETDFRSLLVGYAPLATLVGARVALNALPEAPTYPAVIYSVTHAPQYAIDGTLMTDQCQISVECWAETATDAEAVAVQVKAAVATALLANGAEVTSSSTNADVEGGLNGSLLNVEWWA